jgi:putative heme transporter
MAGAHPGSPTVPTAPVVPARPTPSRRSILIRIGLLVVVIAFVIIVLLPRLVDYEAVGAVLASLTFGQLAALVVATSLGYIANAGPSRLLVAGLSWHRAVAADIAGRAVVSTIPGPTDVAVKFVLYRQWGIPSDMASAGIALAGFFELVSSLVLPLIATISVIASGRSVRSDVIRLTLIGLAVFVVASLLLVAINRSEAVARRFGKGLDWIARHVWPLFRKTPPAGLVEKVLDIRARSSIILSRAGIPGFGAAVVAKLAWFVVLEISLWVVGVSWDVLPPSSVLAAMAIVGIVAFVPITPGAVGVSEVAYVGLLSAVAGQGASGQITAAVLLFRIAQWLAPIPIGWIVLAVLRGSRVAELFRATARDEAHAAGTGGT